MTTDSDGITFEIDAIGPGTSGLLEVAGRWYGVRGRRFVRPTLTLTLKDGAGEVRMLADLELKPWAAEEGDPWRAGFAYAGEIDEVAAAELNVAPDITVALGAPGAGTSRSRAAARAAAPSAATGARTPVIRDNPARPRPRAPRTAEVQRLHERLTAAEAATAKERARRDAAEAALEQERRAARRLQAELARLRAERELTETMQSELDTASTSQDRLRRELRELGAERDQIRTERDEAQRSLAAEQTEVERLRSQLSDAEAAVRRLTQAGREARIAATDLPRAPSTRPAGGRTRPEPAPAAHGQALAADDEDERPVPTPAPTRASGDETERMTFPLVADADAGDRGAPARGGPVRGGPVRAGADRGAPPPLPRRERPLNPSLQSSSWIGRGIALIMLIMVIVAFVLVISSTGH